MNNLTIPDLLTELGGEYAFYDHRRGQSPYFLANANRFSSASLIKIPILLAWAALVQTGEVSLDEICDLDAEAQVKGAGFARRLHARRLPYHDVLLMMIATSDNLCSNLAIQRIGIERLNSIFRTELGLTGTLLQRKLMDFDARERGLDNWISAKDCIHLFELVHALPAEQLAWVEPMLLDCQNTSLLLRDLARDSLHFHHKTGSIPGVLHDWGYTRDCDLFLLSNHYSNEAAANRIFGQVGGLLLP
jgi:beta-lactamase class A